MQPDLLKKLFDGCGGRSSKGANPSATHLGVINWFELPVHERVLTFLSRTEALENP
jgi:hypothetical protein